LGGLAQHFTDSNLLRGLVMHRKLLSSLLILALAGLTAGAENWPNWRGPNSNGVSSEKNLPEKWASSPEGDANIAWKLAMPGMSGATPAIWGDRIFVNVVDGDNIGLWCVDRKAGQPIWKRELGPGGASNPRLYRKQNMSSPSPVTDGKNVWVMTGTGLLRSFDFEGRELWQRDIQKDYGPFGLNWGYASSPLLHENSLYVQVLHGMKTDDPSYVLRIDKKTGKTTWRVERPTQAIRESPDSYTTPAVVKVGAGFELVITGGDCVTGHDLETGNELWRLNGLNPNNNPAYRIVASPVIEGDIIIAPTRVGPMTVLRAGGRGDVTESHRIWSTRNGPDVPTPVTDGKLLYVVNDRGIMFCFELLTGNEVYSGQRIRPGIYSSSLVLADGKLYATSEEGVTTVVKAGPNFEVLAENNLNDYTLSSPAISGGQIFLRTSNWLWAIGRK
jgi:outer membrane protein assembly factor BamB